MYFILLAVIDGSNYQLVTNYIAKYQYEVKVWDNSSEKGNINVTIVATTAMINTI